MRIIIIYVTVIKILVHLVSYICSLLLFTLAVLARVYSGQAFFCTGTIAEDLRSVDGKAKILEWVCLGKMRSCGENPLNVNQFVMKLACCSATSSTVKLTKEA